VAGLDDKGLVKLETMGLPVNFDGTFEALSNA
jgi:hypothetical protein